jgi:hypothetical protein
LGRVPSESEGFIETTLEESGEPINEEVVGAQSRTFPPRRSTIARRDTRCAP